MLGCLLTFVSVVSYPVCLYTLCVFVFSNDRLMIYGHRMLPIPKCVIDAQLNVPLSVACHMICIE